MKRHLEESCQVKSEQRKVSMSILRRYILNHLKTEKAKQSALAMLRQIQILEG